MCTTFPGQRNRFPTARLGLRISEQPFAQGGLSTSSAISPLVQATCWFSWFGCAAYGLLFKRTRALRSDSVFKAIAMLAKPAKICQRSACTSGEICTLILEGDRSVQIVCSTLLDTPFVERCTRQKNICNFMAFGLYVSGYYLLNSYVFSKSASFVKTQEFSAWPCSSGRDTTAQAFGEIFADFSSIAIARDALFERKARVRGKSNP